MARNARRVQGERPGALVIGASSGIGEALARQLIEGGYRVALVARREDQLRQLCAELGQTAAAGDGGAVGNNRPLALAYPHDVTALEDAPALFARIAQDVAPLRLVIYAAGVMPPASAGDPRQFAAERAMMETNAIAAMRWLGLAADELERRGQGTLVGVSSVAGDRGRPGNGAYMASKAALSSYLDSLRYRLRARGVTVVTIKPGYVVTPMTAGLRLPGALTVTASAAARRILRASQRRRGGAVYVPGRWKLIMWAIRRLPDAVIGRMRDPEAPPASRAVAGVIGVAPRAETLEGYGMRQRARCLVVHARTTADIATTFDQAAGEGWSVGMRGSGCSYGDAALNAGQIVIDCASMNRVLAWDPATGVIVVEPGVTIEGLWRRCLADGWWPPVVPGTMAVSVGGATASNIHGKNQWLHGSFGEHILGFELLLPSGDVVTCTREHNSGLFFAAIGGWGLLGAFTSITLQMRRIFSGLVDVRQTAHSDLDALLAAVEAGTASATHLVAWIDTSARGRNLGRGLLKAMRELQPGEDPEPARFLDPASQPPSGRILGVVPAAWIPVLGKPIATPLGIRLANAGQWRRGNLPGADRAHRERYVPANFMLNFIPNFKNIYRPGGLIQHQTFAPREVAADLFRAILQRSRQAGLEPSLAVLKKHRTSPFLLNYLPDGYSLALDFAAHRGREAATLALMDELNTLVAESGGHFFLAKDSTLTPEQFYNAFAPDALARFHALKTRLDPARLLQTDIYRRVMWPALEAAAQRPLDSAASAATQ